MVKRTQLQKKKLRLAWTLIKHLETVKQTRLLRNEGSPSVRAEMGSIERLLTVECAAVNEAGLNDKQLTQLVTKLMKCVEAEKIGAFPLSYCSVPLSASLSPLTCFLFTCR